MNYKLNKHLFFEFLLFSELDNPLRITEISISKTKLINYKTPTVIAQLNQGLPNPLLPR